MSNFFPMQAATLNCLMCGAPARSDAAKCEHCGARLATVACPSCFGMLFQGSKYCPHCGAAAERSDSGSTPLPCPKCKAVLEKAKLGATEIHECSRCHGIWVDVATFEKICSDREKQSAVLGTAREIHAPGKHPVDLNIRYVPCPTCSSLMHRVNFARCSGVIVDVCKGHGTWFDQDELQHIVEFIRLGGLDKARQKEKEELEAARRRLLNAQREMSTFESAGTRPKAVIFGESDLSTIAGSFLGGLFSD